MRSFDHSFNDSTLGSHLRRTCQRQAGLAALGCDGEQRSYGWLAARAAYMADRLTEHGVRSGDRVGVCLERSAELVVMLLACIRSGVCFVPLEPTLPLPSLRSMARRVNVQLVVMGAPLRDAFPMPVLGLRPGLGSGDNWPEQNKHLAVCLLPAEVTGRGDLQLSHQELAGYLQRITERAQACAGTRWLAASALADEAAVLEILGPLWVGGYVEITPTVLHNRPGELAALLQRRQDINTLQGDVGFWERLLKTGWRGHCGFQALCAGADRGRRRLERLWLPPARSC